MKIALAGNPNSGKTTLFNAITGKAEYVGNWPGVTVEKKEADLKKKFTGKSGSVRIVDLPGAYSIEPHTGEEIITRDYVTGEKPDVIINIVDATNMSRSLYFTSQLMELDIPVVVALNKNDISAKRGDEIDLSVLEDRLNIKVVSTSATAQSGLETLMEKAIEAGRTAKGQVAPDFDGKGTADEEKARQGYVDKIAKAATMKKRDMSQITLSDKIDQVVAHKWLGLPIFFLVMWGVFSFSIEGLGGYLSEYVNETLFGDVIPNTASSALEGMGVAPLLQALIVDGAIGGVGAVLGFLPLIMVLFFCLALLEDSGYMARVAVIMDRYFKKIGLSGKSIIPMIVGSGCAIPGVMATRTIEDVNERRMTTILTPFVPCGAKLPIIALFAAVFFPTSTWVGPAVYVAAIAVIILGGLLLKKMFVWENTSSFILELPEYKIPSLKHAFKQMIKHAKAFIYKASTIILVCNTLVWFAQTYSWTLQPVEDAGLSILATIGNVISPILIPLGLVGWQLGAAALTGFIAKENVVATLAVVLVATSEEALHLPGGTLTEFFTPVTALAYLAFNLFTPPCFAAIGAMNSEMGSKKWLIKAIGFQLGVGYVIGILVSQIGSFVVYGKPGFGFGPAVAVLVLIGGYVTYLIKKANSKATNGKTVKVGA
jgi:ferrous iron transport protein B